MKFLFFKFSVAKMCFLELVPFFMGTTFPFLRFATLYFIESFPFFQVSYGFFSRLYTRPAIAACGQEVFGLKSHGPFFFFSFLPP